MYTIAVHNGTSVSREHNRRNPTVVTKEPHIRPDGNYEIWRDISPRDAYEQIFGNAVTDYNKKQNRNDRKIKDYYESICHDKNKHAVYECIVGVYAHDDDKLPLSVNRKILRDYVNRWRERNPNLALIGAYYHNDEQGKQPHLHLDYVPVAHGYKRGMSIQNGLVKALGEMGYTKKGRETAQIQWQAHERTALEEICLEYGIGDIEHPQKGKGAVHLHTEAYKAQQELFAVWEQLDEARRQLEGLPDPIEVRKKLNELSLAVQAKEAQLDRLNAIIDRYSSLKNIYDKLLHDLHNGYSAADHAHAIVQNHPNPVQIRTIRNGFKQEKLFVVNEDSAYEIKNLYSRVNISAIKKFESDLNYKLPLATRALSSLAEPTKKLLRTLQEPDKDKIIQDLKEQLVEADNDLHYLEELEQFISDYNLGAYLDEWRQEQQEQQQQELQEQEPSEPLLKKMDGFNKYEDYSR